MTAVIARKESIDALTGIRIIAASYVLLFHIGVFFVIPLFPEIGYYYNFLFGGGWMGVDLFFLLSGFIISYNYHDSFQEFNISTYLDFLVKRLARIYPVHFFCLTVLFVIVVFKFGDSFWLGNENAAMAVTHEIRNDFSLKGLFSSLFLVHAWNAPFYSISQSTWVAASWSVSCEWLAYILFPLTVLLLSVFKQRRSLYFIFAAVYIITLVIFVLLAVDKQPLLESSQVVRIFFGFTIGVVLYKMYELHSESGKPMSRWMLNLVMGICVLSIFSGWLVFSYSWMMVVFSWLIYAIACGHLTIPKLSSASFIYGGKLSYSLYMVHGTTLVIYSELIGTANFLDESVLFKYMYIASYIVLTFGGAVFCYHFIEEPSRRAIIKRWRGRASGEIKPLVP